MAYYDDPFYALLLFLLIILLFLQLSSTFLFSSEACFSFLCYATSHMGKDKLHIMYASCHTQYVVNNNSGKFLRQSTKQNAVIEAQIGSFCELIYQCATFKFFSSPC